MRMGRFTLIFVIALLFQGFPLAAQSASAPGTALTGGAQEAKETLPQWLRDLRRADIILFGSFPFAYFLSTTVMDTYRSSQHNWDTRYAPWPLKSAGAVEMTTDEHIITITTAAAGAALMALADYIIVRIKRNRVRDAASRLAPGEPIIIRKPWPPVEAEDEAETTGDAVESPGTP